MCGQLRGLLLGVVCIAFLQGCSDSSDSPPKKGVAQAEAAAIEAMELHLEWRNKQLNFLNN